MIIRDESVDQSKIAFRHAEHYLIKRIALLLLPCVLYSERSSPDVDLPRKIRRILCTPRVLGVLACTGN